MFTELDYAGSRSMQWRASQVSIVKREGSNTRKLRW